MANKVSNYSHNGESIQMVVANKSFSGADMVATCQMTAPDGTTDIYTIGSMQTLTYSIHMERRPIRSIGNINAKDYVMGPRTIAGSLVFAVFNKHFAYEATQNIAKKYKPNYAFLTDELPPFDMTVSFANEYGAKSRLVIYGIRLINEGQVMSVNDIYTENTYQFVATDLEYLTDANGYSSYKDLASTVKFITPVKKYADVNGKALKDNVVNMKNKDIDIQNVTLQVDVIADEIEDKKGLVKFGLMPWQSTGTVTISGDTLRQDINMNVADYKNQSMYLALSAGKYKVDYFDNNVRCEAKEFSINHTEIQKPLLGKAPIIEACSSNAVILYSNELTHTAVKYAEIDNTGVLNFISLPLQSRKGLIYGLKENTQYIVFTTDGVNESLRLYVRTNKLNTEEYDKLKDFCRYNEKSLKCGLLTDYYLVIDNAKTLAINSLSYMSLTASINKYKSNCENLLKYIKPETFNSQTDYATEVARLNKAINISKDLLLFGNSQINNIHLNNNQEHSKIKPATPTMINAMDCVFVFDKSIDRLEFYREYENVDQFALDVREASFKPYSTDLRAFKFFGKPGVNHYVYAFDKAGQRSPKLQFYVFTDSEISEAMQDYSAAGLLADSLYNNKLTEVKQDCVDLKLSQSEEERFVTQLAKAPSVKLMNAPTVSAAIKTVITVDTGYDELVNGESAQFFVAIAPKSQALMDYPIYKQAIEKDIVIFDTGNCGLKTDEDYIIWIENLVGVQVSEATSIHLAKEWTDELYDSQNKINLYLSNQIVNSVTATLASKITLTEEIKNCIENLKDSDTTWNNVFDKLINNVINHHPRISNQNELIQAIYVTQSNLKHTVDLNFFESVRYETALNRLELSPVARPYTLVVKYIDTDSIRTESYAMSPNVISDVHLDSNSKYIVIYGASPDLTTRSGMIFINQMTHIANGYKLKVGVK